MLLSSKRWSSSKRSRASSPYVYRWYLLVYCSAVSIASQPSVFQTDDGVDAETSLSLSLHLYLSSPPLHFILVLTFGQ